MVLIYSEMSSECGRESDVGVSESGRQEDSRTEIYAWANKDLASNQRFRGRFPVPRKRAA